MNPIAAAYQYNHLDGRLLYETVRLEPKDFRQRCPDGAGGWTWALNGTERIPYRWDALTAAAERGATVFVVEGEKDADRLVALGLVATTSAGGAGWEWPAAWAEHFRGCGQVVVVADNDEPGRRAARQRAGVVAAEVPDVRVLELPGLEERGDVSDWLDGDVAIGDLWELVERAPQVRGAHDTRVSCGAAGGGSSFFTDRGLLITAKIGEHIRSTGNLRTGDDGRLYRYKAGVYRADGEVWGRAQVRELLGDRVSRNHFSEVITWLGSFEPTVHGTPPTGIINVANGLLDWRTGELVPHDPEFVSTVQLPVEWHPEARCPRIEKYLHEVLPGDAIEIAEEVLGYAFYAANPFRKAVLMLGAGGNGKSVFLRLVTALLGAGNYASVPVQVFGENRFAPAELFGKLANIAGDLDARAIKRSDIFKMITGGDPIMAERKNCHPFSFVSYALPIFSANEPPISSDQTQAWFDRWLIIPMERRIEGTAMCDPHLASKLTTAAEMQGVLVLAVDGLRRLMERGRFDEPAAVRSAGEQYRERLDTARGFVADACVLHMDAWTPRTGLYRAYREWCSDSGKYPVSAENFYARLRADYPGQVEERGRRSVRGWAGIGLSTDRIESK